MTQKTSIVRDLLLGFITGMVILSLVKIPYSDILFPVVPYEQVSINNSGATAAGYRLNATFLKNECEFQYMEFYGKLFGAWERIPYIDTADPLEYEQPVGDRIAGWHTFDVVALTDDVGYTEIELRTRHKCTRVVENKEVIQNVDKVFFSTDTMHQWDEGLIQSSLRP